MANLLVRSVPERFRRAGMEFSREPREVEADPDKASSLRDEPMLVVEEGAGSADGSADGNEGGEAAGGRPGPAARAKRPARGGR